MKKVQQTSLLAYWDLPETPINMLKRHIFILLCRFGALTDSEIIARLRDEYSEDAINRLEPRVRRHEMAKEGIIYYKTKRKCQITGKLAMVWAVRGYN